MSACRIVRRRRARLDIEEAAFWYATEANADGAERFVAAVETAMRHIATHPAAGSLRYADFDSRGGLRFWPVSKFPWLIFYRVQPDHIDVLRALHAERDIPHWLLSED